MESKARSLIERCVEGGDDAAWEAFVDRFESALRRGIAAALSGRPQHREVLLEDLLQEVYCRLLERGARRLRRCSAG